MTGKVAYRRIGTVSLALMMLPVIVFRAPAAEAAAPGDVVSAASAVFTLDALLRIPVPGVRVTRVLYRSTDARGAGNVVSGTVLVPATPYLGKRPIVGYAVGTQGLGDRCAPSNQMAAGTESESGIIVGLLERGWAVAVTDYEGLGTPGQHTYMVGPSMGRAVLDVIRAATRLPGTGLAADAPVTIWGYSQGGAASSWAAQLQPTYAPELRLKGVATGGVPADVLATARNLDGGAFFGLAVAAAIGLDAAFPELQLSSRLNTTGQALLGAHENDCLADLVLPFLSRRMNDLTTTDLYALPEWQGRYAESRLGMTAPGVPVLMYHAVLDEVIPYSLGTALRDAWCARGVNVRFDSYLVAEHASGVLQGVPSGMAWLSERFAGLPAVSTCSLA